MNYVVLSLKYRPQIFEDVVGQDHVTRTLINAFKKDRVAQGYLFTGPRGVGKTTTARILAKALNCQVSQGAPCNKCSNCLEIIDGRNMDVLEIDGASNRGIEEIRNLREQIKYTPMNSPFKIFIIDEVHMLTTQAFNALLRTLEEPPAHGKFILATTDVHKVPQTILSRCQRFDFNRMTIDIITSRLNQIVEEESIEIDDLSIAAVARKADGSMRDALSLLDQVIAYSSEKITYEDVTRVLGLIPLNLFFDLFEGLKEKDAGKIVDFLSSVRSSGLPVSEVARGINENIRNLLFSFVPDALGNLELSTDVMEIITRAAKGWDPKDLVRISRIIAEVEQEARTASQPLILLEISLMKLLEMDSAVRISDLIHGDLGIQDVNIKPPSSRRKENAAQTAPAEETHGIVPDKTENTGDETQSGNTASRKKEKTTVKSQTGAKQSEDRVTGIESASEPDVKLSQGPDNNETVKDIENIWKKVYKRLLNDRPSIASVLEGSTISEKSNNRFILTVFGQSDFSIHMAEKGKGYIEKLLSMELNANSSVNFILSKKDSIKSGNDEPTQKKSGNDETVAKIIELFDGEIIQ